MVHYDQTIKVDPDVRHQLLRFRINGVIEIIFHWDWRDGGTQWLL